MSDDLLIHRPLVAGESLSLRSMQEVAMNDRNASKMLRTYNVAYWGNNYYDVNELGHISVCPDGCPAGARRSGRTGENAPARRAAFACAVLLPADPPASLAFDQRRVQTRA